MKVKIFKGHADEVEQMYNDWTTSSIMQSVSHVNTFDAHGTIILTVFYYNK